MINLSASSSGLKAPGKFPNDFLVSLAKLSHGAWYCLVKVNASAKYNAVGTPPSSPWHHLCEEALGKWSTRWVGIYG